MLQEAKRLSRKILALILILFVSFMTTNASIMYANEVGSEVIRSLQGKITDENGHPVVGASIQIGTYSSEYGFRIVGSASTNEEGEYSILNYTRNLGDAVSTILSVKGYIVINQLESQTFNFQIPEQRTTLTGKVTYGDMYETPVAGYPVYLSVYLGRGGRINIASTLTDSEGNYTFSIIPGEFNSALGENRFRLVFDNNYEEHVELHLGENRIINGQGFGIPIPPEIKLNGRLAGYITDELVSIHAIVNVIESVSGLDSVVLTSITSNESSNQSGAGHTSIDVQNADYGTNDTTFDLRAERSGKGAGRVYTITYTAVDKAGNIAVGTATVTVPKK